MAESIKTMMGSVVVEKDETTVQVMYTAVTSRFAKKYWDEDVCQPLPPAFNTAPLYEFTIDFGRP